MICLQCVIKLVMYKICSLVMYQLRVRTTGAPLVVLMEHQSMYHIKMACEGLPQLYQSWCYSHQLELACTGALGSTFSMTG